MRRQEKRCCACLYPFLRSVTMVSGDDRACLSFELLAENIAPILHHSPIAGYAFERTNTYRPAIGFFLLFSLLRSEEHTSELQSQSNLVCRLLLEKKIIK